MVKTARNFFFKIDNQALITLILAFLVLVSTFQTYQLLKLAQSQEKTQIPPPSQTQPGGVQNSAPQTGGC